MKRLFCAALCAFALLAGAASRALADVCPAPTETPKAIVTPLLPPPDETHKPSYHDLTKEMGGKLKPSQDAMGVSSADMIYKYIINTRRVAYRGHYCYYLTSVDMKFGYSHRLVEIARELPEGSCLYKEVRGHEYRHVSVDNGIIRDNLNYVTGALQSAIQSIGAIDAPDSDEAHRRLTATVSALLEPIVDHVSGLREAAQDQVDTEAEYARVEDACRVHLDPAQAAAAPNQPPVPPMAKDGK
jgi:hypothetical protein